MNQEEPKQSGDIVRATVPPASAPAAAPAAESVEVPATGLMRVLWLAVAVFCGFWIVFPEPSDAIPILGWLDEMTAAGILFLALSKVGLRIPLIQPVIDFFLKRKIKNRGGLIKKP